ncbi:MAG: CoA transferase [Proteobacteria bacterium]|nr:CoA transferase [Pseudomonadota bacterium]
MLRELLALTRLQGTADFSGADPVLRTPYRVGTAGAAALAAVGIAASKLWTLRTGRRQKVAVDLRAAAASLRSGAYLRIDGKAPPPIWDPMSGFYPVRDGRWISIHCNFANHRRAAMKVLGVTENRDAAEAATRAWAGLE